MSGETKPKLVKMGALAKPCELSPEEECHLRSHVERRSHRTVAPRIKASMKGGALSTAPDHPNEAIGLVLLMEALGTADPDFFTGLVWQLANVGTQGQEVDERGLNFALSMVKAIEPRDELEAMLAAQMAATHNAIMTFARRLNHVENIAQQDSAERAFNKLARTFASQVEALKRYRSSGEQTVRVEHVTVNEGGQAIVGNVTHRGRGSPSKSGPTS
jgi:hypothetical protein